MRLLSALLFCTFCSSAFGGGPTLPDNWRMPTDEERCHSTIDFCFEVIASGDFDGNGLVDGAVVAISENNAQQGLWVFMYESSSKETWTLLDSLPFQDKVSMGVEKVSPGLHKVLCQEESECADDAKKTIKIKNESFSYYRFASASSLWAFEHGKFNRIWQSD